MSETDATLADESAFDRPDNGSHQGPDVERPGHESLAGHTAFRPGPSPSALAAVGGDCSMVVLCGARTGWIELTTVGPPSWDKCSAKPLMIL